MDRDKAQRRLALLAALGTHLMVTCPLLGVSIFAFHRELFFRELFFACRMRYRGEFTSP